MTERQFKRFKEFWAAALVLVFFWAVCLAIISVSDPLEADRQFEAESRTR